MSDVITQVIERMDVAQMRRGEVVDVTESGTVLVTLDGEDATCLRCDVLVTTEAAAPVMVAGDQVLTWAPPGGTGAVVLGRIGPSRGLTPDALPEELPDTVTLEAKHSLELRVGEGSITIREDGKILIKGKDLVSHAQRMNRIKGGAVSIN
jgi:hypothetical protein